jgi:hypothetical protein
MAEELTKTELKKRKLRSWERPTHRDSFLVRGFH